MYILAGKGERVDVENDADEEDFYYLFAAGLWELRTPLLWYGWNRGLESGAGLGEL